MFASLGAYGHLHPMMPLALACGDAGHKAVIASGPPFLGRLSADCSRVSAQSVYGSLCAATAGYQRNMWLQRNRTPPAGNGLLVALINPAPPTLRQTFASETMIIPIRSWPTTSPALRYRRGSPRRLPDPGSISPWARSRSAPWRCSAARSLRLLRSMWTCWSPSGRRASLPPLGEVPDNVHVERFVAQSAVLPLIDIIVHHGGTASTLEVGPPQLLLSQGADQSFMPRS